VPRLSTVASSPNADPRGPSGRGVRLQRPVCFNAADAGARGHEGDQHRRLAPVSASTTSAPPNRDGAADEDLDGAAPVSVAAGGDADRGGGDVVGGVERERQFARRCRCPDRGRRVRWRADCCGMLTSFNAATASAAARVVPQHGAHPDADRLARGDLQTRRPQLRASLTSDRGSRAARLEIGQLDADTDLSVHSAADLDAVAAELNDRPRRRLAFSKPIGSSDRYLLRCPAKSADALAGVRARGRVCV
jgi:hypothetical protein